MAGPGGGPPRKSHTKSRKGCRTCKKRHIRCDENYPQCRNCTKHNCRCDYMDNPPADDMELNPRGPNLLWTPWIVAEVDNWMRTGLCPFPELVLRNSFQFQGFSRTDLRLVHHLASIYSDLHRRNLAPCTAWVEKLPIFLDTAAGYDFVMSAILAFSATNLASETNSVETKNLAYHHRGVALNGLQMALSNFSQENSDPILAASILLSWQASDWSGWTSLMQGISSVVSSMDRWKASSNWAYYVEAHVLSTPPTFAPPQMNMLAPVILEDDASLDMAIHALRRLCSSLQTNIPLLQFVETVWQTAQDIKLSSTTMREEHLFEKLHTIRSYLLWTPIRLVQGADRTNLNMLAIALLYATALAIDTSFPELNGAAFGALTTAPIEEIDRRMQYTSPGIRQHIESSLDDMMQFPRSIAQRTRHDRALNVSDALLPGQQSPFSFHGPQQGQLESSAPTTPNFPPTYPMLFANHSWDDLSVPPSPFLSTYNPAGSRPISGVFEPLHHSRAGSISFDQSPRANSITFDHSPRPTSLNFDQRAYAAGLGESPKYSPAGYSPAYSTGPAYVEEDLIGAGQYNFAADPYTCNYGYDSSYDSSGGGKGKGKVRNDGP